MERYREVNALLQGSAFFYTIVIGMDSTYTFVSPNYDRNFSSGQGSLKGQHFSVTLHPDDVKICEAVGPLCFARPGELLPVTLRKHNGQGGFVSTQWEMQAMLDAGGAPQGIFCIGYNITELVQSQARLYEIGFIQSHGVRRPLANILGLSRLLEGPDLPAEPRELVRMLRQSAEELDQVIREISAKA